MFYCSKHDRVMRSPDEAGHRDWHKCRGRSPVRNREQVTSTTQGVYLIHREDQEAISGVAVYFWGRTNIWECEEHGVPARTSRSECEHIKLARKHRDREEARV